MRVLRVAAREFEHVVDIPRLPPATKSQNRILRPYQTIKQYRPGIAHAQRELFVDFGKTPHQPKTIGGRAIAALKAITRELMIYGRPIAGGRLGDMIQSPINPLRRALLDRIPY